MKCKQCDNELTGKKVYCDDACRMAFRRSNPNISPLDLTTNPNRIDAQPEQTQPEHEQAATRTNPDLLNYGKPMSLHQLDVAKLKANRVPIPGDADYTGCCEQVDGQWRVRA